jgi:NADH-quinone oxidoreductase subunit M
MKGLLSVAVFLPLVAALALAFVPRSKTGLVKVLAGIAALAALVLTVGIYFHPRWTDLTETYAWIHHAEIEIDLKLKVDGISAAMMLLTALLTLISMACSWRSIETRAKEFFLLLLALETGMLGVFAAYDLFLFYVFWEITLIPMYFLIGAWGGPRRLYASIKFIVFTVAGSLFMLAAIIYVAWVGQSFDLERLADPASPLSGLAGVRDWLFLAFFFAFAVKVPIFPLHTWLPDAHVEAPTAGSVILAGVLLKMGTYGLIRIALPLFPESATKFAGPIMILAVIGIVYGALMALAQGDIKRLIAYSSVSHMGFVVLGIFAGNVDAMQGAVMAMVNHGLSTGALFLLVGMIYDRTHRRGIDDFGGLAGAMPRYSTLFLLTTLSSIGLPGLNGFIGEVLVLIGTFAVSPWIAAGAALGVILGAVYMLRLYRLVFFGRVSNPLHAEGPDLTAWEFAYMAPLALLMIALGIVPSLLLDRTRGAVEGIVRLLVM